MISQRVFKSLSLVPIHEPSYLNDNNLNPFTQITPVATSTTSSQNDSFKIKESQITSTPIKSHNSNNETISSPFIEGDSSYHPSNPSIAYPSSPSNGQKEHETKKINKRTKTVNEIVDSFPPINPNLSSTNLSKNPDTTNRTKPGRFELFDLDSHLPPLNPIKKHNAKTLFDKPDNSKKVTKSKKSAPKVKSKPAPNPKSGQNKQPKRNIKKRKQEVLQLENINETSKKTKTNYNFKDRLVKFKKRQEAVQDFEQTKHQQEIERQKKMELVYKNQERQENMLNNNIKEPLEQSTEPDTERTKKDTMVKVNDEVAKKSSSKKKKVIQTRVQVPASDLIESDQELNANLSTGVGKHKNAVLFSQQNDNNNITNESNYNQNNSLNFGGPRSDKHSIKLDSLISPININIEKNLTTPPAVTQKNHIPENINAQSEDCNNTILKSINEFKNYISQQVNEVSNKVHNKPDDSTNNFDLTLEDGEQTIVAPQIDLQNNNKEQQKEQQDIYKSDYRAPPMFDVLNLMLNDVTKRMEMVDTVISNKHQQLKLELDRKFQGLHDFHRSKVEKFLNSTKDNLQSMIISENKLFDGISND